MYPTYPVWWGPALLLFVIIVVSVTVCAVNAWHNQREGLIARAEIQHAALMNGNERYGTYGEYPPAKL